MKMIKRMVSAGVTAFLILALAGSPKAAEAVQERRTLTVALYPFIPNPATAYLAVEQEFERLNGDVNLVIVANDDYYNPEKGVQTDKADVYELDSVFLADFVNAGKIQPLPGAWDDDQKALLAPARAASRHQGRIYGAPHWLCGNFLFYWTGDEAIAQAKALPQIEAGLKASFPRRWLISDFYGSSTLGEMYLDALMDLYGSPGAALTKLDEPDLDPKVVAAMSRTVGLFRPGFGRDSDYHYRTGFYGGSFGRGEGRAFVGYSENLYYALGQKLTNCRHDEVCLDKDNNDVQVAEWPLADQGSKPIAWTDLLVVDAKTQGETLKDAEAFVRFMTAAKTYDIFLIPAAESPPRYLLPARRDVFEDPRLAKVAPLYPKLLPLIEKGEPITAVGLNAKLRAIGKRLDGVLPKS